MKRAEIKSNLKALFAAIGDRPAQEQLAWVTINYEVINPLNEAGCTAKADSFRRSLQNTFKRRLPGCKAVGHMDISEGLVLHAHLLIWAVDLDHIAKELRKVYGVNRSVSVKEWYGLADHKQPARERIIRNEISLDDLNVVNVTSYGVKVLPEITFEDVGRVEAREHVSRIVGERLLGLLLVRGNRFRGGRIQIGLRRAEWKFDRDLMVNKRTGEYKTIRLITGMMAKKRKRDNGFIESKIIERRMERVLKGGYVLLTGHGPDQEYMDPATGEIITVPVTAAASIEPSPAPALALNMPFSATCREGINHALR